MGIMRYVLPITVFLKLRDLGEGVLPGYKEVFLPVEMTEDQQAVYKNMESVLRQHLKVALRNRDNTLTGVVMAPCCHGRIVVTNLKMFTGADKTRFFSIPNPSSMKKNLTERS